MAQNSDENKKRAKKSLHCPATILNAIPNDCEKITFSALAPGENYKNKAIIGKISSLNPIGKRANGFIRKILITDALENEETEDQMKLTIFLLDDFAKDSDVAEVGSYMIITNFQLEKSTYLKANELPLQVLVKKNESQVLFGRRVTPKGSNEKKSVKKKNRATDDDDIENERVPQRKIRKKTQNEDDLPTVLSNHYDYIKLEDLRESEAKETFNVYGMVEKCDLKVIQGKRTQILELMLTDQTETGFLCSIFAAQDEVFPDIYPGDIVRVHRMQVFKFRSRLKGKCLSPKFILVFSKCNKGSKPRTVAKSFTFSDEDSLRVKNLFEWYQKKSEPKLICELNRGDFANIVCQVIGVYCAKTTDAVILKIWDGTKTNQIESSHYGLKDEILDEKLFLIAKNYYVILSIYGQYVAAAAELKPGQYIEVRDAHLYSPKVNPDECKLCVHAGNKEGRGIQVLENDDLKVIKLKERLEKIKSEGQEFGNQTDDILCQNNSIFLNCDISMLTPSQRSTRNEEEAVDVESLNQPLSSRDDNISSSQNAVISITEAAVKPGQSTQEFGGGIQKECQERDNLTESAIPGASEPDPVLNKTPIEFRMFLHNSSNRGSTNDLPFIKEAGKEEQKTTEMHTISVTDVSTTIKASSIAEVLQHDVPYKFRIMCVIMNYKPEATAIHQLIHLYCPKCFYITEGVYTSLDPFQERDGLFYFHCPECSLPTVDRQNWPELEYVYLIVFDLHDGTHSSNFEVFLWGNNAVEFFNGITPEDVLKDTAASNAILQMLWNICPNCRPLNTNPPNENAFAPYPILDCCVLSYETESGVFYQMFNTRLK